jgi:hypothetical protein
MNTERRQFARIPFLGAARLQLASATLDLPVQVVDVSFKGALIELPPAADVAMGDTGTLVLLLGRNAVSSGQGSGSEPACITMLVDVAHLKGPHAGLQCRSIDLDSVTHLRRLLAVNMGDAALLERDLKALLMH